LVIERWDGQVWKPALRSVLAVLLFAEVFSEEFGDVAELRNVVRIYFHQGLVRLQASASNFLAVILGGGVLNTLHFATGGRPTNDMEQMHYAQILQEVGNAVVGI
jgi:hypothetical protein